MGWFIATKATGISRADDVAGRMTDAILSLPGADRHGLRRRKNCALFVAGMVTDLLVPSSVTLAVLVTQIAWAASVSACSNPKLAVSTDGQETTFPPAVVNWPPAYRSLPDAASALTWLFIPEPSADQLLPFHLAM